MPELGWTEMEPAQPGPGEELNTGAVTTPRLAASVIVLRGEQRELEVLLVQRNPASRFMGGAWVFPGGAVDAADGTGEPGLRAAGVREVEEEAGIAIPDATALVPYSRWITPSVVKIRFDTWFFLAPVPYETEPRIDGGECVDWRWSTPQAALDAYAAGDLQLVFPTIKHLEQLAGFPHADALVAHARGRRVEPVEPRVVLEGEVARVLLPGDPGYATAAAPAEA
jgi:8-oxo-dGTP pyrophosphatase MutT (NUDIX family)